MNEQHSSSYRSWAPGTDAYPGLGQPFAGPPAPPPAQANPTVLPAQSSSSPIKLPFNINMANINEIKAMIDRMGGIEGVLNTMGKVQKFMSTVQQVAPLVKLFMGKGKNKSSSDSSSGDESDRPRRRRRSARRRPASRKRRARRR
ncbi:MAG: hypothetical protein J7559_13580 [Cohnella sp.]|nr:hypothetical protein [Cohnella sp.]